MRKFSQIVQKSWISKILTFKIKEGSFYFVLEGASYSVTNDDLLYMLKNPNISDGDKFEILTVEDALIDGRKIYPIRGYGSGVEGIHYEAINYGKYKKQIRENLYTELTKDSYILEDYKDFNIKDVSLKCLKDET